MSTQISKSFDIREFVPKSIYDVWGERSTWFVNPLCVKVAEFYKSFFLTYYKNKLGNDKVSNVLIVVNNWHTGGVRQFSAIRPPYEKTGAELSQHRFNNAFDCEIIIVFADGKRQEADYNEIHKVIQANEAEFMANGVTCVESVEIATGWLHTDFRWIPNQKHILIVKPSNK